MAIKYKIEGMKELERTFKKLGSVPQTVATKAAKAGATIGYKAAKSNAPEDEGNLKKGLIMKRERRTVYGKTVYDTMPNPKMNDVFRRQTATGLRNRKNGKEIKKAKGDYYYPASQEYGFLTKNGGYVPGYRYLRKSIEDNKVAIERKMVDVAGKEIDKVMRR